MGASGFPGKRVDAHRAGTTITLRMARPILSEQDKALIKRLSVVLVFVFVFVAAFSHLLRVYSHKFFDRTGPAKWIWAQHPMKSNEPLAFFAAREIELPPKRIYTRLKIAGDPEYTLYVNGREIAGRRVGEQKALDYYDISDLVQTGRNRIVVAIRAPQGIGGLLAAIDIAPETQNWVVSNEQWKIYRRWDPLLLQYDIAGAFESPMIVGKPPIGRWNYLEIARRERDPQPAAASGPADKFLAVALRPEIVNVNGIAVATAIPTDAAAFDFGFTKGRVRISTSSTLSSSRVVPLRFAYQRGELGLIEWNLRPIVFAPGESEVTTPEVHSFRYVMAFARDVDARVLKQ
jgi:hypothetical protein